MNGSLRDITEEKLLERKLRGSRENLHASITEVRESMAALPQKAAGASNGAEEKMKRLDARSQEIRKFTRVISEIARTKQHAGPQRHDRNGAFGRAGLGFAVVADEVKRLAGATSNATTDISRETDCNRRRYRGSGHGRQPVRGDHSADSDDSAEPDRRHRTGNHRLRRRLTRLAL